MPRKTNPWITRVKKVKKAHPSLSFAQVLKKAKQGYKKKAKR